MKMFRKLVSIVAAATLLTSSMAFSFSAGAAQVDDTAAVSSEPNLQDNPADGVILHAFNWSYNSIKQNLPQIKAAGYSTVQTSPVTQPKNYGMSSDVANQWWKLYQPVSLSIAQSSWLGTKADLKDLCTEADKYGIKIIVDIVANHMANNVSAAGVDLPNELGPEVKTYEPTLYNSYNTYFHTEKYDASDSSAESMTRGHVSACPDLNTANGTVQQKIYALLKDCIDCGVDGFRFDAAKHIETESDGSVYSNFWAQTLDQARNYYKGKNNGKDLFAYGEILNTLGGRNLSAYTKRMRVTENKYSDQILAGVNSGSTSSASATNYQLSGNAKSALVWAESHDTYMGESGSAGLRNTSGVPNEKVVKAWAIVAARQGSTPLYFARPGSSLMGEASSDVTYKSTVVSEVNKFHNAFANTSAEKVGTSGSFVYVARGSEGVVLVNVNGGATSASVSGTGLANGNYVDTVTGNAFTVSGGTLSGNVGSTGVAVVYKSTSTPKATASVESGNFTTDTMTVQLGLENAVSGTYALENSTPVSFTGTPTIRIGSDYKVGETITLNLTATDAAGQKTTNTYYYTKKTPTSSGIYVFLKPSIASGWTNVSCYVYDEDTKSKQITYSNGGWPGQKMTLDSKLGYYYIEIPAACVEQNATTGAIKESTFDLPHSPNTYVIFNGTKNNVTTQYPGANVSASQKLKLGGGSSNRVLDAANSSGWKNTTMTPTVVEVQATNVTKGGGTPISETTEESTTAEPTTEEIVEPVTQFKQLGIYGDVNQDGVVSVTDITAIQRHIAEFSPLLEGNRLKAADVDLDGAVSIKDVTYIQMYLAEYAAGTYAHTGEPYGEYIEVDPDGRFSVTAKSNLFATATGKFASGATETVTVTYFMNSAKDLLSTDWTLTYDSKVLEPVSRQQFMPKVGGATYNTAATVDDSAAITGNASVLTLVPMQTEDNKAVPFVSATFRVLKSESTTVNLNVKDLTVSELKGTEKTSKAANETDIIDNGVIGKPDSAYTLYTTVYSGSLNETYDYANAPKVVYDPNQTPSSEEPSSYEPPIPEEREILFTNNKGWGVVNIYAWTADGEEPFGAFPGTPMTDAGMNGYNEPQFKATVPTNIEGMVFNDGGLSQTVDVPYSNDPTGWYPTDERDAMGYYLVGSWIDEDDDDHHDDDHHDDTGTTTIEFTDNQGWGQAYIYMWSSTGGELSEWPGFGMNKKGENGFGGINYTYDVPNSVDYIIFSNGSGDQTVDITHDKNVTGWYPTQRNGEGKLEVESWTDGGTSGGGGGNGGTVLFTNNKGWGSVSAYAWNDNSVELLGAWPGTQMQSAGTNDFGEPQFSIAVPEGTQYIIFTDGISQTVDIPYDSSVTGYYPTGEFDGMGNYMVSSWKAEGGNQGGGQGGGEGTRRILFTDNKGWGSVNVHYWGGSETQWPGAAMSPAGNNDFGEPQYSYDIPTNIDGMVFNGPGGQTVDVPYDGNATGWYPLDTKDGEGKYQVGSWSDGGNTGGGGGGNVSGDYYLVGYINGADVDGTQYGFSNGQITMNFSEPSYVCIRNAVGNWFMANGFPGEGVTETTLYSTDITGDKSDKLWAPAGSVTFTLTANSDGTFTLSEGDGGGQGQGGGDITPGGTVLFTNNKGWGSVSAYAWDANNTELLGAWPGTAMQSVGNNDMGEPQYSIAVPTGTAYIIFTDGISQTVDIPYDSSVTGYYPTGEFDGAGNYMVDSWTGDGGNNNNNNNNNNPGGTVLFTNNRGWGSISAYAWTAEGPETLGAWPGTAMTSVGNNDMGEPQYSIAVPAGTTYIIFTDGISQTVDIPYDSSVTGYYPTGEQDGSGNYLVGSWIAGQTGGDNGGNGGNNENPNPGKTIEFTSPGWSTVYCYVWDASENKLLGEWPGAAMTYKGDNGMGGVNYTIDIPSGATNLIFSDGNGDQTVDITYDSSVTGYWCNGYSDGKRTVASW